MKLNYITAMSETAFGRLADEGFDVAKRAKPTELDELDELVSGGEPDWGSLRQKVAKLAVQKEIEFTVDHGRSHLKRKPESRGQQTKAYWHKSYLTSAAVTNADKESFEIREIQMLFRVGQRKEAMSHVVQFSRLDNGTQLDHLQLTMPDHGLTLRDWRQLCNATASKAPDNPWNSAVFVLGASHALFQALHEMHTPGFLHVDLKDDNVCLPIEQGSLQIQNGKLIGRLDLSKLTLIDLGFSLAPEPQERKLWGANYSKFPVGGYIAPRFIQAATEARDGNLTALQNLDWRVDFYGLGAMIEPWAEQAIRAHEGGYAPKELNDKDQQKTLALLAQLAGALKACNDMSDQEAEELPHIPIKQAIDRIINWETHKQRRFVVDLAPLADGQTSVLNEMKLWFETKDALQAKEEAELIRQADAYAVEQKELTAKTALEELLKRQANAEKLLAQAKRESDLQALKEKKAAKVLADVAKRKIAAAEADRIRVEYEAEKAAKLEAAKKEAFVKAANEKTVADLKQKQEEQAVKNRDEAARGTFNQALRDQANTQAAAESWAKKQKDDEYAKWLQSTVERNRRRDAEDPEYAAKLERFNQFRKQQPIHKSQAKKSDAPIFVGISVILLCVTLAIPATLAPNSFGMLVRFFLQADATSTIVVQPNQNEHLLKPPVISSAQPKLQVIDGYEILDDPVLGKSSLARDPKTGLVWQRCSVGQQWSGHTCTGEAKRFTFNESKRLATQGWRAPDVRELASLIFCSSGSERREHFDIDDGGAKISNVCLGNYQSPTIQQQVFPLSKPLAYWAPSPKVGNSDGARTVNFAFGGVGSSFNFGGNHDDNRKYSNYVRLVRTRP